ncbi:unnamed protein product [Spirodela intermedia]|uniref:Uncharacterized protein n=1 Tax=Spirodela intermedia TaxID=51605 RepID=A0A7I8JIG1_SPIIN|nr:unnamed protein product [Spirodela intermedia]CAA6669926.1 unnamed protein product [Spirodela intermedia]
MCFNLHPLVDARVKDSESVDLEAGFFPKIRALWIQAHILFIFCCLWGANNDKSEDDHNSVLFPFIFGDRSVMNLL